MSDDIYDKQPPYLVTRQILANGVAARWAAQYARGSATPRHNDVLNRLLALPIPADPDEVDRIIGNGSWTRVPTCSQCGNEHASAVVVVGEIRDYESSTAILCGDCLSRSLALLGG